MNARETHKTLYSFSYTISNPIQSARNIRSWFRRQWDCHNATLMSKRRRKRSTTYKIAIGNWEQECGEKKKKLPLRKLHTFDVKSDARFCCCCCAPWKITASKKISKIIALFFVWNSSLCACNAFSIAPAKPAGILFACVWACCVRLNVWVWPMPID